MADDKKDLTAIVDRAPEVKERLADISTKDLEKVHRFIEDGLPGIGKVDDIKMRQIMDLYLSGKTYNDICDISGIKKTIIHYLSYKFDWPTAKNDYLIELESTMRERVLQSRVVSKDFMLQLTHMWQRKIGNKINKYLSTGDESIAASIDLKEIDKYLKTVEMLHTMDAAKTNGRPMVGINAGDGVTITKTGENSVDITPNAKEKTIGSILKQFADARREEEKQNNKPVQKSDIKEVIEPKEETNEED